MDIAIIYHSVLGHSKRIALAIAQALNVEAYDIRENPDLMDIDLLCVVSGIYGGKSAPELLAFIKSIDSQHVKQAVLLTSSAGRTTPAAEVRARLTDNGIPVIEEEFTCQGAILLVGIGRPNKTDLQNAIEFVLRIVESLESTNQ